jgi:hypothetical protein
MMAATGFSRFNSMGLTRREMDQTQEQFAKLFRGYEQAHGQHELNAEPDATGKLKGRASTKAYGASDREYAAHLKGSGTSLGLIPLLENNTVWFGAIDIDIKGDRALKETPEQLEKRVRQMELPLVVCKSKSGGAHLYLLCSEPISAKIVTGKLSEYAARLGYSGTEIFPKQTSRVNENDRGNWINIAYYGALSKEGTTRYCIRNGKPIPKLDEFVKYADMMRVTADSLKTVDVKLSDLFSDGPPCLQQMVTINAFGEGGRNNAMYNVACYFKMRNENSWTDEVAAFNQQHVAPPLEGGELNTVMRNVGRKEYFYTCKQPPICNHCDKKLCATREFGITGGKGAGELFPIENLTKCSSKDSVRWYAEHQGARVELTTEQLFSPNLLQRVFAEKYSLVIIPGKQKDWAIRLKELMETCDEVTDPDDASRQGQFENLVDNFFSASRPARNKDELIKGNSFVEEGRILFRSEDLLNYLSIRRFQHTPHEVWMWLKAMDAKDRRVKVKGRNLRVWTLPEPEKFDTSQGGIALPNEVEEEL